MSHFLEDLVDGWRYEPEAAEQLLVVNQFLKSFLVADATLRLLALLDVPVEVFLELFQVLLDLLKFGKVHLNEFLE